MDDAGVGGFEQQYVQDFVEDADIEIYSFVQGDVFIGEFYQGYVFIGKVVDYI